MKNKKIRIGLVGCGVIGSEIARAVDKKFNTKADLVAISDVDKDKAKQLRGRLKQRPVISSINGVIKKSDLIIEAASPKASSDLARKAISKKKDIMIMSSGGIVNNYASLFNLARRTGSNIYLPSGAICGLDGIKAAFFGGISMVELTTRKPPAGLKGAPYLVKKGIAVNRIKEETVIFKGSAKQAIKAFPKNINVSCVLSMAGIGPKKTKVKIITSPKYKRNSHEISIEGEFGRLTTRAENVPSPNNPKTSYLAVLSAIATLKQILDPVRIGT